MAAGSELVDHESDRTADYLIYKFLELREFRWDEYKKADNVAISIISIPNLQKKYSGITLGQAREFLVNIQQVAKKYLKDYPSSRSWFARFFSPHTHQKQAKKLNTWITNILALPEEEHKEEYKKAALNVLCLLTEYLVNEDDPYFLTENGTLRYRLTILVSGFLLKKFDCNEKEFFAHDYFYNILKQSMLIPPEGTSYYIFIRRTLATVLPRWLEAQKQLDRENLTTDSMTAGAGGGVGADNEEGGGGGSRLGK